MTQAIFFGSCSRKSWVNQRSIVPGAIAASPLSRMVLMRPFQISLSAKYAEVLESTSFSTRCGALAPSHMPTMPPIERPHQLVFSIFSASSTASTSRPSISMV